MASACGWSIRPRYEGRHGQAPIVVAMNVGIRRANCPHSVRGLQRAAASPTMSVLRVLDGPLMPINPIDVIHARQGWRL